MKTATLGLAIAAATLVGCSGSQVDHGVDAGLDASVLVDGGSDARAPDAAASDTGATDGGRDASRTVDDASVDDAASDASASDGGTTDAALVDAGGDASVTDASVTDASRADGGSGGAGACGTHPVLFQPTCASGLAACGGDVSGTWCDNRYCIPYDRVLGPVPTSCSDFETPVFSGTMSGRLVFTGSSSGTLSRYIAIDGAGSVHLASGCGIGCASLATFLASFMQPGVTSSCTSDGGAGCNCDFTVGYHVDEVGTFDVSGTTITEHTAGGDHVFSQYCVFSDGSLRYADSTSGDPPDDQWFFTAP